MNITYTNDKVVLQNLTTHGFFVGWPQAPNKSVLRASIANASYVTLAVDENSQKLIGYITALSDGVLSAYIPFLEVLPEYQEQGIGSELVERMLEQIGHLYMVDVVCDKEIAGFYEKAGFVSYHAMIKRNYDNQKGVERD